MCIFESGVNVDALIVCPYRDASKRTKRKGEKISAIQHREREAVPGVQGPVCGEWEARGESDGACFRLALLWFFVSCAAFAWFLVL